LFNLFHWDRSCHPDHAEVYGESGHYGGTVGLLVAAFSLTQLLFSPLADRLSDMFGRKRMIVLGMLLFALSEGLFGFANSSWLLFVSRMLGGKSAAMIMPAVMAYAADVTTTEERAAGMGFINATITTGFIIGPGIRPIGRKGTADRVTHPIKVRLQDAVFPEPNHCLRPVFRLGEFRDRVQFVRRPQVWV
jgi:hypothetical protein